MKQEKDVLIKIKGTQKVDGESDVVELLTMGSFLHKAGSYYISYQESETTGFEGSETVMTFDEQNGRVTMRRLGKMNTELIIEEGRRHQCNYDTGYGSLTVGVSGDKIVSNLNDEGGDIFFGYSLDINMALTSENSIHITVAPEWKGAEMIGLQ